MSTATEEVSRLRIIQLEKEVLQARVDIRVILDEQDAANEKLLNVNDLLEAGSDKLQSLYNELENSREELQSTHEEILAVNKQLFERNEQLNNTRLYADGIINTIRDPLIILDQHLRVKRATSGFYQKFKLTEEEAEGNYIYEIKNSQWDIPELRKLLEDVLPAKKALADIEIIQIFSGIGKRIMCVNAREIDNIHGEKLILLALEDITDKRKVEEGLTEVERLLAENKERLKFAVDSAGLGTWDYEPQIKQVVWDKRCREIFGLTGSDVFDMETFLQTINEDDRVRVKSSIRETLNDKDSGEFDLEFRTAPVNSKIKWLKAKGRAYFNESGVAVRFIGTLLDITVQRLLDEATRDLLNKKDEFVSIASHELKTPITSLKAVLQMIEKMVAGKDEMKKLHLFVQKGIKQVDKLTDLIKDLLEVTKIQAGKLELKKTHFKLDELLKDCCEDSQILSEKHHITTEGDKGVTVYADRNRLEQVIINLISNAIKYSPDADKVVINVAKTSDDIKVAVTDFGIGIPKETLPFLFDRFYRVDEVSQRYSGLGLGLYISAEIVKRHHGEVGIASTAGKGSTFWFTIPAGK